MVKKKTRKIPRKQEILMNALSPVFRLFPEEKTPEFGRFFAKFRGLFVS
jgi:hypothetical protein